ncbi:2'-5' RNA ligase family protein [Dyella sp. EPa41]|uniref:2'-5' RNA ligase family protein n=1 Tax=Dyella sp. EPa41 TaxID=1561194 RepID=UPI001914F9C4|nr:2'-5' RNA ligase family protein [Dyella sp. EPa41]
MNSRRTPPHVIQPDLLGGGSAPAQIHRLFFALLPDEATRSRIEAATSDVAASQHLRARMIRPARYHATLHFLGDHPRLREDIAAAAAAAGGQVRGDPFEWVLDSASGFHGREPPCVLRCTQTPPALQALWQALREALLRAGLGAHLSRSFTPHVTFAYSRGAVPQPVPVEPIPWRVEGFALLHSIVGGGDYRTLDTWRLQPR